MRRGTFAVALALAPLAVACGDSSGYVYMDDDLPSENCPDTDPSACESSSGGVTTATSSTTTSGVDGSSGGGAGECQSGADCMIGEGCLAPFDGDSQQVGEFACVPGCIGIMDDAWWCADASACCDADATCTLRGYCVLPDGGGSESSGGGSSGSGESGSDSGSSSGG